MVSYGTSTLVYSDDSGVTKPQDADKAGVYTGLERFPWGSRTVRLQRARGYPSIEVSPFG